VVETGPGIVQAMAFSGDHRFLVTAGLDNTVKLWDTSTGHQLRTFTGHTFAVNAVAFGPAGRIIASGGTDKTINLWDAASGVVLRKLSGHTAGINGLAFSPKGDLLASASSDKTIKLWDVASGQLVRTLAGHTDVVNAIAFSPDGTILCSAGGTERLPSKSPPDYSIRLWNVATGSQVWTFDGRGAGKALAFNPDGSIVASIGTDTTIRLLDVNSGRQKRAMKTPSQYVGGVSFSPDGKTLASSNSDKGVRFWDVASGQQTGELPSRKGVVVFSRDWQFLAFTVEKEQVWATSGTVAICEAASGRKLRDLPAHASDVNAVAFGRDAHILASGSWDGRVRLWDLTTGGIARILQGHSYRISSLAFNPDGTVLASGSWDGTSRTWDVAGGRELRTFAGHTQYVNSVKFNPDGKTIASASYDGTIKLWNAGSGTLLRTISPEGAGGTGIFAVAFSPDGRTLASGGLANTVRLWDVATGREQQGSTMNADTTNSLAFSPDGSTLAWGGWGYSVKLWNVADRRELPIEGGHDSIISSVAFSPDGKKLISAGLDSKLVLWDRGTGSAEGSVRGDAAFNSVVLSPNGNWIATGDDNGTVQIWDMKSGMVLASLVALDEDDWVVFDSAGHFDTNNLDEIVGLSWVFPDEPFRPLPPEVFMRDYYAPKLLSRVLSGQKLPDTRSLSDLNRVQPRVNIVKVEPEDGNEFVSVTVKTSSVRSDAQKDAKGDYLTSGLFDLRLFRDGQLVGEWPEVPETPVQARSTSAAEAELQTWRKLHEIASPDDEHTFHHIRVPLGSGPQKVQFTAYAFNSDRVKSLTSPAFAYTVSTSPNRPGNVRRAYLITMGVNANQSRWNLDLAVPSAQDAARLLHKKMAADYEVVDISLFSTLAPDSPQAVLQQATKDNLKAILSLLAGHPVDAALRNSVDPQHKIQPARPDDAVVLFIASHGYADPDGNFHVVPYDTGPPAGVTEYSLNQCHAHPGDSTPGCQKANQFLSHTISSEDLTAWWSGVDAGEMVMILDSCHSAAATGREFRPGPLGDAGLGQLSYDKGMRILTATQADKTARATLVQQIGHSLLVEALIAEAQAHPRETVAEWLHDTEREVPLLTHRLYPELSDSDVQSPQLFDFGAANRRRISSDASGPQ
jgi:WD40 repeat protein